MSFHWVQKNVEIRYIRFWPQISSRFEVSDLVPYITVHSLTWLLRSQPNYLFSLPNKPSVIFMTKSFLIPQQSVSHSSCRRAAGARPRSLLAAHVNDCLPPTGASSLRSVWNVALCPRADDTGRQKAALSPPGGTTRCALHAGELTRGSLRLDFYCISV